MNTVIIFIYVIIVSVTWYELNLTTKYAYLYMYILMILLHPHILWTSLFSELRQKGRNIQLEAKNVTTAVRWM